MRTAAISGGLGDTIYSIRTLHALQVKRLYVKQVALENGGDTYTALKDLIEMQGIECLPTPWVEGFGNYVPELQFDYDMDASRTQPRRGNNHIICSFMQQFKTFDARWREPWLNVEGGLERAGFKYTVLALTPRWRDNSKVDWAKVWRSMPKPVFFLGFRADHDDFIERYTNYTWEWCEDFPSYRHTNTLLEAAQIIKGASAVYCNQNSLLTIAQGLGKEYWLEHKPHRTNTLLGTKNEHILS